MAPIGFRLFEYICDKAKGKNTVVSSVHCESHDHCAHYQVTINDVIIELYEQIYDYVPLHKTFAQDVYSEPLGRVI